MEKLLEQAQALVVSLAEKVKLASEQILNNDKTQIRLDDLKVELDNFQADLLQREVNVKPIENIGEMQRLAVQSKAEAELEWSKIRGEWQKLDQEKAKDAEERRIGKAEIADKKALYDRGAVELQKDRKKLEARIKKFQEAAQGV